MDNIRTTIKYKPRGNFSVVYTLLEEAWKECEELQETPLDSFIFYQRAYWKELDAWEIICTDGVKLVGALGVTDDWDVHCGVIKQVVSFYVLPEYRDKKVGMKLFNEAKRLARNTGGKILGYTHRVKPWTYLTRYIKL